jgi:archaellum component FlaC
MKHHFTLLKQYTPPLNPTFSFPKDSQTLDIAGDPWEWQPGYNNTPTPNDKVLWAESGEDVAKYKAAFIAKHKTTFKRPFKESTMMIAPVDWRTGYDPVTEQNLVILALKQGEATEIKNAIGIVNTSIQQNESLLYQVQNDLKAKRRLENNAKYIDLARREAPEELATLKSDIAALEALEEGYGQQLNSLRTDGNTLNQELSAQLKEYKETAKLLNIDDGFAKKLEEEVGSARLWSFTGGGVTGIVFAGIGLYLLASSRRGAARRTRTTGRGADGLFFRA